MTQNQENALLRIQGILKGNTFSERAFEELQKHFETDSRSSIVERRKIDVPVILEIEISWEDSSEEVNPDILKKKIEEKIFHPKKRVFSPSFHEGPKKKVEDTLKGLLFGKTVIVKKTGDEYEKYIAIKKNHYRDEIAEQFGRYDAKLFDTNEMKSLQKKLEFCGVDYYHKRYTYGKHLVVLSKDKVKVPEEIAGMVIGGGGQHLEMIRNHLKKRIDVQVEGK